MILKRPSRSYYGTSRYYENAVDILTKGKVVPVVRVPLYRPVALYPVSAGENVLNSPLGSSPSPFSRVGPP